MKESGCSGTLTVPPAHAVKITDANVLLHFIISDTISEPFDGIQQNLGLFNVKSLHEVNGDEIGAIREVGNDNIIDTNIP